MSPSHNLCSPSWRLQFILLRLRRLIHGKFASIISLPSPASNGFSLPSRLPPGMDSISNVEVHWNRFQRLQGESYDRATRIMSRIMVLQSTLLLALALAGAHFQSTCIYWACLPLVVPMTLSGILLGESALNGPYSMSIAIRNAISSSPSSY